MSMYYDICPFKIIWSNKKNILGKFVDHGHEWENKEFLRSGEFVFLMLIPTHINKKLYDWPNLDRST